MTLRAISLVTESDCLSPDTSLLDALHVMLDQNVSHLPVCNNGTWAGLLDINDILGELLPAGARGEHALNDLRFVGDGASLIAAHLNALTHKLLSEVDLHDLPTLDEDTPFVEAALLLHRHASPLPVLDSTGRFKGMLSHRILLAHLIHQAGR